jgi:uncharacterized membrane protein
MKSKLSWLEAPLLLAPFIVLAIYWQQLPARVPMHWNLNGEVNRWAPKLPGLFLLPLLIVGLVALLHFLPRLDPKLQKTDGVQGRMGTGLAATRLAMLLLLDIIFYMQIAVSLGWEVNVVRVVVVATLVFFAIIGNYLGTPGELFRRNPHALDIGGSANLASDASPRGSPGVLRRARPPYPRILPQDDRLHGGLRRRSARARRLGIRLFLALLAEAASPFMTARSQAGQLPSRVLR